jgi:hypothetical protein
MKKGAEQFSEIRAGEIIASYIVEYLLENGVGFVRIFDNLSSGLKSNITPLLKNTLILNFFMEILQI